MRYFTPLFMEEAQRFLAQLDHSSRKKVLYDIELATQSIELRRFKKLRGEIWEFRTNAFGRQIRLLAFWDKTQPHETLVVATHGFYKKGSKVELQHFNRAERLRTNYFENKQHK